MFQPSLENTTCLIRLQLEIEGRGRKDKGAVFNCGKRKVVRVGPQTCITPIKAMLATSLHPIENGTPPTSVSLAYFFSSLERLPSPQYLTV